MNPVSILFVDDEPNVLSSIRRMLRTKCKDWNLDFSTDAREALQKIKTIDYDVIVSDIKMPEIDGAELLKQAKEIRPSVLRIALSGQVDLNGVIKSVDAVHQYISKPCTAEGLLERIQSALDLRKVINDPKLISIISQIDSLPVVPRILQEIETELAKEEPSIKEVAAIVSQDVGLVTKVLKLINSPYFSLPAEIRSIDQSISLLGLETIRSLIVASALFEHFDSQELNFSIDDLWNHSFRVAAITKLISEYEGLPRQSCDQARLAGLLHDIGKILLITHCNAGYSTVLTKTANSEAPIFESEQAEFSASHAEVAAYLLGLWGMKKEVVEAIAYHHNPEDTGLCLSRMVQIANAIDHHCVVINSDYTRQRLAPSAELNTNKIKEWMEHVKTNWNFPDEFIAVDPSLLLLD